METEGVHLGYIRRIEKNMEATISYYSILGIYRENGKENGSYYCMLGISRENRKEN